MGNQLSNVAALSQSLTGITPSLTSLATMEVISSSLATDTLSGIRRTKSEIKDSVAACASATHPSQATEDTEELNRTRREESSLLALHHFFPTKTSLIASATTFPFASFVRTICAGPPGLK